MIYHYEFINCILKQLRAESNVVFYTLIVKPKRRKQKKFKNNLINSSFNMIVFTKEQKA
jgi:hypothetical protein